MRQSCRRATKIWVPLTKSTVPSTVQRTFLTDLCVVSLVASQSGTLCPVAQMVLTQMANPPLGNQLMDVRTQSTCLSCSSEAVLENISSFLRASSSLSVCCLFWLLSGFTDHLAKPEEPSKTMSLRLNESRAPEVLQFWIRQGNYSLAHSVQPQAKHSDTIDSCAMIL